MYKEIARGDDELFDWIKVHSSIFLPNNDQETQEQFAHIANWVNRHRVYSLVAKKNLLAGADPWLIAYSIAHKYTIVTEEISAPLSKSKIKIPDVCRAMNVPCINTIAMMRQFRVRLIAEP